MSENKYLQESLYCKRCQGKLVMRLPLGSEVLTYLPCPIPVEAIKAAIHHFESCAIQDLRSDLLSYEASQKSANLHRGYASALRALIGEQE